MFILVVAFLCVATLGAVAFTDIVEEGPAAAKAAFAQLAQHMRPSKQQQ